MAVKMRTLIWGIKAVCILTLIVTITIFGIAICHLNSEERSISVPVIEDWWKILTQLLCFWGCIVALSIFSFWAADKSEEKYIVAVVLVSLFACFTAGIYFTIETNLLVQNSTMDKELIFASTKSEIVKGIQKSSDSMWLPVWLTTIQEESKTCCGIRTFNDWNDFWAPIKNRVPKSCCRVKGDSSNCHTDLQTIPFPDTWANNIKVDSGCDLEINEKITQILTETFILSIMVTVYVGLCILAFLILYTYVFLLTNIANDDPESQNTVRPMFQTDEETWESLDIKINPNNNKNDPNNLLVGASSGGTLEESTNTDLDILGQNQDFATVNDAETEVNTTGQTQFIPEVNSLAEVPSDYVVPSITDFLQQQQLQQQLLLQQEQTNLNIDILTESLPQRRHYLRRHRRRHE